MRRDRYIALLLLTILVLVTPAGFAALPDQTWLEGLWDGGDDDEAILEVQSTVGSIDGFVLRSADPKLVILGLTPVLPEAAAVAVIVSSHQSRAPPVL